MNHYMNGKTILFYGIPAYGHIYSNLYLTKRLCEKGFRIIYYSLPPFREVIEGNGCEYRPYPLGHCSSPGVLRVVTPLEVEGPFHRGH